MTENILTKINNIRGKKSTARKIVGYVSAVWSSQSDDNCELIYSSADWRAAIII